MNNILILDTETSGLPLDFKSPPSHDNNWPHLVQLAWQCYTPAGDLLEEYCQIVKPNGWTIAAEAEKTHGISLEVATEKGLPIESVIKSLMLRLNDCKVIVCHNTGFDKPVVLSEFLRLKNKFPSMHDSEWWIERVPFYCTMLATTSLLAIPHPNEYFRKKGQFKWPSLDELHAFLFGCAIEGRDNFHDALVDVKGTARCYFELLKGMKENKWFLNPLS